MTTVQQVRKDAVAQATDLQVMTTLIRDGAIDWARGKLPAIHQGLELAALLQRNDFFDYFKYALANGVAEALAMNDANVHEVYICDPTLNPDCEMGADIPMDGGLHLIVRVTTVSAALESFIAALDRALLDDLRELPTPVYAGRSFLLDANIVTEEEIREGTGYARMLSSMYAPPIKVWAR
jgi:hypothetical protein